MITVAVVLSLVVFGGMAFVVYRKRNPKPEQQKPREAKVGKAVAVVRAFARSNRFRLIAPAPLSSGGGAARLDAIVVGYFGVLGVVVMGYNGEVYGAANEENWLQVTADKSRTYFPNPMLEASANVRVIRDALFSAKLKQIPVEVACVYTDRYVQLAVPKNSGQYKLKQFKAQLRKEKYLEDTGLDLDKVEAALRAALV